MDELYVLRIISDVPALAVINGSPAGTANKNGLYVNAAKGSLFLTLLPLTDRPSSYLPMTRRITLGSTPALDEADGGMELFILPGGVAVIKAYLMPVDTDIQIPHILAAKNFSLNNAQYRATVYFDRTCNLAIESAGEVIFCTKFEHCLTLAEIFIKRISNIPHVFAVGQDPSGSQVVAVSIKDEPALEFIKNCKSFSFKENGAEILLSMGDPSGFLLKEEYSGEPPMLRRTGLVPPSILPEKKEALSIALYVKHGAEAEAMACLAPSLKGDVSFADLLDFFEDFSFALPEASGEDTLALAYPITPHIYNVRIFKFEFQNGLIQNITED